MSLTTETLGRRLRLAIEAAEMTQQAVAEAAGMDPTALCKALAGKRNFSTLEFALICSVLNVSVLEMLNDGTPPPSTADAGAQRIRWMLELDEMLTRAGFPPSKDRGYPATLLDRAVEAYLVGRCSIRPIACLIGADPDELLEQVKPRPAPGRF